MAKATSDDWKPKLAKMGLSHLLDGPSNAQKPTLELVSPKTATVVQAKANLAYEDGMNGTERAYSRLLEAQKNRGEIAWWEFEAVKLKVGADTSWYVVDFMVIDINGLVSFVEVKGGFWRDDAVVKFKAAKAQFPFFGFKMMSLQKDKSWKQIY